jgi:hypothetical protein
MVPNNLKCDYPFQREEAQYQENKMAGRNLRYGHCKAPFYLQEDYCHRLPLALSTIGDFSV